MFDLDAYLERIGLSGRPSIAEVHRAHLTTIPFESLDPYRGIPVSLATRRDRAEARAPTVEAATASSRTSS